MVSNRRKIKAEKISKIADLFQKANQVCIVNIENASVNEISEFRRLIKANNADFIIFKNTLVKKSLEDSKDVALQQALNGPNGFIFGYDKDNNYFKLTDSFNKKYDLLPLKAGIFENKVYLDNDVNQIANLLSRQELLTKFIWALKQPASKLLFLLNEIKKLNDTNNIAENK